MRNHNAATARIRCQALLLALALLWSWPAVSMGQLSSNTDFTSRSDSNSRDSSESRSLRDRRRDDDDSRSRRSRSDDDDNRRSSRSKDSSDNKTTNQAEQIDAPSRARAQEKSTIVKKKPPRNAGGGRKSVALPSFKINPDLRTNALYFEPAQLLLNTGERFTSRVVFYNGSESVADSVDLWLHWDPALLELEWLDLTELTQRMHEGEEPATTFWPEDGYLHLSANLRERVTGSVTDLFVTHWRAKAAGPATEIAFIAPEADRDIVIGAGEDNLIAPTHLGNQGWVAMRVRVQEPVESGDGLLSIAQINSSGREGLRVSNDPNRRVRLALLPRHEAVGTGEIGTVDVVLLNPALEPIDALRFTINYDPEMIKILDADEDNYIAKGLNIFDGDFHYAFPFDHHVRNEVDPERGLIRYEMRRQTTPEAFAGGTVARIVFRMERLAGVVPFTFEWVDPISGIRGTDVLRDGESLLGTSREQAAEVLHGTRVSVAIEDL